MKLSFLTTSSWAVIAMMAEAGGAPADSPIVAETGFLSLAALAGANTDEIRALTSRVPAAGIFRVRCLSVAGTESAPVEGKDPMFRFGYKYEIISAKPVDKAIDADSLVGGNLTESFPIFVKDLNTGIGLLKGRHQLVGLPNSGVLGGVEGQEPGWLDTAVGAEIDIRIRHGQVNGDVRAFYDWLKPEVAAPADA